MCNLLGGSLAFIVPIRLSSGAFSGTEKVYRDLSNMAGAEVICRMFTVMAALVAEGRPPPSRAETVRKTAEHARWPRAEIR